MSETVAGDESNGARAIPRMLVFAWASLLAFVLIVLVATALFGNPHAGDAKATVDLAQAAIEPAPIKPAKKIITAQTNSNSATASGILPPPSTPITALSPAVAPPAITKPVLAGKALVADPALIEQTDQGPLPRIANDGRTPIAAYAPPVGAVNGPRIAIVIKGLGMSEKMTAAAIAGLPPAVTLAFTPYSDDLQRWVSEARKQGHEVLLEVPMEPYDFPDSDPGPNTLRIDTSEDGNIAHLKWSLTRFTGYVGITNLLGGRFLGDPHSLEPVMAYLQRRGLMLFDSIPPQRSVAPGVAKTLGAPYLQATASLDNIQTGAQIDQRLSDLETQARANGGAAGEGFVYPVTIDRVANWAKGLQGRGFVLVPASAIVSAPK